MDYISILTGFFSGVLLSMAGAWINISLSRRAKDRASLEAAEYEMYLKLNELHSWYFWYSANELHNKETPQEVTEKCHKAAVELAKLLHKNEKTIFAQDLIKILYDESYDTYDQRWKHMLALSEKMSSKFVPVHHQQLNQINIHNINLMSQEQFVAKAPASSRFVMKV